MSVTAACGACLFIGDDNGDRTATMTCQLQAGHPGHHIEKFERPDDQEPNRIFVSWTLDERVKCDHCDEWEHEHSWSNRAVFESCAFRNGHNDETCRVCKEKGQT